MYLTLTNGSSEKAIWLKPGIHYKHSQNPLGRKTPVPKLPIKIINPNKWLDILESERLFQDGGYVFKELHIDYEIHIPSWGVQECEASRIMPGVYTGAWIGDLGNW
jgi:hypothetical protein